MSRDILLKVKLCHVCGEKVTSGNFWCGACKLFFYRNSAKIDKFKCYRKERCSITKATRKHCNKCRLDKCLSIGMKSTNLKSSNSKIDTQSSSQLIVAFNNIDSLLHTKIISEIVDSSNKQLELTTSTTDQQSKRKKASILNKYQLEQITALQSALSTVFNDETKLPINGEATGLIDGINISPLYLTKIIKFCKNIPAFNLLCSEDQLSILKPFCCEMMFVRTTFYYDTVKDGFYTIEDEASNNVVFIPWVKCYNFKNQDLVCAIKSVGTQLFKQMENDQIIRDLIIAQLLFKPRNNLKCFEFARYNHILYKTLLRQYFEQKYGSINRALNKYYSLNALLENIAQIKENERILLLNEIDSKQIPHLLAEIYNL